MNSQLGKRKWRWFGFFSILALTLIIDQLTKQWALKNLAESSIILIPGIFTLTLRYNFGSAFGWRIMGKEGLTLITIFITVILLLIFSKITYIRGISIFLAGAWGNILDRWRFGYVVDFIEPSFWATFNLADVFIIVGTALILLSFWWDEEREN
ncbi:MAG: signal peptidase II [Candidatus Atribacteria bacterium]|mgnify:FL=1|nr:signal peptidase II [Candidatus Atribacteria bacterium]